MSLILRTCKKTVKSEFKNILLKQYSRYKRFYCRRSEFTVCASTRNSMHLPHLNKLILKRITKSKKKKENQPHQKWIKHITQWIKALRRWWIQGPTALTVCTDNTVKVSYRRMSVQSTGSSCIEVPRRWRLSPSWRVRQRFKKRTVAVRCRRYGPPSC